MIKRNRTQLVLGILLILAAAWLILARVNPDLGKLIQLTFDWPVWVMLSGALILFVGLLVGAAGMAVPACIVAGIGGILYFCDQTGNWGAWAYLWTLIPGFVGVGALLSGLLGGTFRKDLGGALNSIIVSLVLFAIFATFFQAWDIFGVYSTYVPIFLLFALGLWFIVRGFLRRKQ